MASPKSGIRHRSPAHQIKYTIQGMGNLSAKNNIADHKWPCLHKVIAEKPKESKHKQQNQKT